MSAAAGEVERCSQILPAVLPSHAEVFKFVHAVSPLSDGLKHGADVPDIAEFHSNPRQARCALQNEELEAPDGTRRSPRSDGCRPSTPRQARQGWYGSFVPHPATPTADRMTLQEWSSLSSPRRSATKERRELRFGHYLFS